MIFISQKVIWPVNQSADGTNFHPCNLYDHNSVKLEMPTHFFFGLRNHWTDHRRVPWDVATTLQWRHDEPEGVSNHHRLDCLLNRLIRQLKGNIKAPHHWPLWGESSAPLKRASSAENVSIWWRHHENCTIIARGRTGICHVSTS